MSKSAGRVFGTGPDRLFLSVFHQGAGRRYSSVQGVRERTLGVRGYAGSGVEYGSSRSDVLILNRRGILGVERYSSVVPPSGRSPTLVLSDRDPVNLSHVQVPISVSVDRKVQY